MAQQAGQRALPQSKEALLKSYTKRLKDDIKSMTDNYTEIIKLAKLEEENSQMWKSTQSEQDNYEMQVRAANMVRAGESLMKLVADLKQFLILNDFPTVNESILYNTNMFNNNIQDCDNKLNALRTDISADLYELEEEYYNSQYK
ncbi:unnamed protein product [Owenia fusiformis]|uniref:Mediator of RNA polymerase II transcription subunit 22 n=1 Tax=Owenia fusiformis TaxID=6347 RepID=A0A8S4P021_OWEFU|nr:unnamed protein product [Owenia fusiformis]